MEPLCCLHWERPGEARDPVSWETGLLEHSQGVRLCAKCFPGMMPRSLSQSEQGEVGWGLRG